MRHMTFADVDIHHRMALLQNGVLYDLDHYFRGQLFFLLWICYTKLRSLRVSRLICLDSHGLRRGVTLIKAPDCLICNQYLSCTGFKGRLDICNEVLIDFSSFVEQYRNCCVFIAGDFNCDVTSVYQVSLILNRLMCPRRLSRCDVALT